MKILVISFCSLLGVLLFSCSSDDIKRPEIITGDNVYCWIGNDICEVVNANTCSAIGGTPKEEECIIFDCKWIPEEVIYGQTATPSLTHDYGENCIGEMHYETFKFTLDSTRTIADGIFSNDNIDFVVQGVLKCTNTETGQDSSSIKDCQALKIKKTPPPGMTGSISFTPDYESGDSIYLYIGANARTKVTSSITIPDYAVSLCDSARPAINIVGSTTTAGSIVKAVAIATCNGVAFRLDSAVAYVLPNAEVGNCVLTGDSKATMRSTETLTVSMTVSNSYGRCGNIEYTTSNGNGSWGASSSFSLSTSGNSTVNARARVTCAGEQTIRNCPAVTVANYIRWSECTVGTENRERLIFTGNAILEFACNAHKNDYYISCQGDRHNFDIEIEGYAYGETEDDIRQNQNDNGYNFPKFDITPEGGLYWYPKEIVVKPRTNQRLECGIW